MAETPSRLRRQLGSELRILRDLAGLTQDRMRTRLEEAGHKFTQATVSRFENGLQVPSRALVEAWAQITEANAGARDRVLAFVEAVHGETRPYPDMDDAGHLQGVAARREEEARRIRDCSLTWLPGLCQTAEYARQLIPLVDPAHSIDHAAAVVARLERQPILYRQGRTFAFLTSEHALRWQPGPGVMSAQRAHLVSIASLADVELRVLRSGRVGAPEWGNFVIYDPADGGESYVATEWPHGGATLWEDKMVGPYAEVWTRLWSVAVRGDDALALIRSVG